MPVYKDKNGKWYCKFYYTDYTGQKKQKKKSGFDLQREAKDWERNFLEHVQGTPDMKFSTLMDLYLKDISTRQKRSTYKTYEGYCKNNLLPMFKDVPVNQITAADIRAWQNDLLTEGKYGQYTLLNIHSTLSGIFNFAVRYYNLPTNPCRQAGSIGKRTKRKTFWTKEQYNQFIKHVHDPQARLGFEVLYFSGCRIGELLALSLSDIDTNNNIMHITKTLFREKGIDHLTPPKTPRSIRDVTMPKFVIDNIIAYTNHIYGMQLEERIFSYTAQTYGNMLRRACRDAGLEPIHVHDLRHSHVSLLIELDFNPLVISERVGHENVNITLGTYAHLYPNKQEEVANKLEELNLNN